MEIIRIAGYTEDEKVEIALATDSQRHHQAWALRIKEWSIDDDA